MKRGYLIAVIAMCGLSILTSCTCATPDSTDRITMQAPPPPDAQWLTSYDDAVAEAKKTGKLIMANFTGSHTDPWGYPWCWKLNEEVFKTNQFKDWAKKNVVLLLLTYPSTEPQDEATKTANATLAKKYNIYEYPVTLFLKPDGTKVGETGYVRGGTWTWIPEAQKIIDENK